MTAETTTAIPEFRNGTSLEFQDISSEEWREYVTPTGADSNKALVIRIEAPLKLHVSASGGHRVFSADGVSHYIPAGWKHLRWKARAGSPHFVA